MVAMSSRVRCGLVLDKHAIWQHRCGANFAWWVSRRAGLNCRHPTATVRLAVKASLAGHGTNFGTWGSKGSTSFKGNIFKLSFQRGFRTYRLKAVFFIPPSLPAYLFSSSKSLIVPCLLPRPLRMFPKHVVNRLQATDLV